MAIEPTVGRTVLVRSSEEFVSGHRHQPFVEVAGIITGVRTDNRIDVMVMRHGHHATPLGQLAIPYAQTEDEMRHHVTSWRWMDYQLQQAGAQEAQTPPPGEAEGDAA